MTARRPPRSPSRGALRRIFARDDEAASTLVNFIVGAAVFLIGSSTLIQFVVEPPGATGSGLEQIELRSKGEQLLSVLLGAPGIPAEWAGDAELVEGITRLGLLQTGTSIRIDPDKFDAIARGRYAAASSTNGFVDYDEAREALGLQGYDFHLRVSPIFKDELAQNYGVTGMSTYQIGYIGASSGGALTADAKGEAFALDKLPIGYDNWTRGGNATGSIFLDTSSHLNERLLPLIGGREPQDVLNQGAGTKYDFVRAPAGVVGPVLHVSNLTTPVTTALALADEDGALGYSKNRELRATLGVANMASATTYTLTWNEYVDTHTGGAYDDGDYGWVEVSTDGGATWIPLTNNAVERSQDTVLFPQTEGTWKPRSVVLNAACPACVGQPEVLVAFHWKADNDNNMGLGWIVDDVKMDAVAQTGFHRTFEAPSLSLLVIGSNVDQNAFTAAEVKQAIRDYVVVYGGRIMVLGGQTNTNWLQPLFHVGIRQSSQGLMNPDPTHPVLTVPNELAWTGYDHGGTEWDFTGSGADQLFTPIVATSGGHVLSASAPGAFGGPEDDGVILLTTYLPYKMDPEEAARFFANTITYGRYHYLYMDFGPSLPENVPVVSVTRTATMNKERVGGPTYVELAFVVYVWSGSSGATAAPVASAPIAPSAPKNLSATAGNAFVDLAWEAPDSAGTYSVTEYVVYRGHSSHTETYLTTLDATTFTYRDEAVTNGVTYYYNITAVGADAGQGDSSAEAVATPATVPTASTLTATPNVGQVTLAWTTPASDGGSAVTGYNLYWGPTSNPTTLLAELGVTNAHVHTGLTPGTVYYYRIESVNGAGTSPLSNVASADVPATAPTPPQGPAVSATARGALTLSWSAPLDDGGSPVTGYKIYAGDTVVTAFLASIGTNTSFVDAGLTDGATRFYNVTAVNAEGESLTSAMVSGTTWTTPPAPLLVGTPASGHKARLDITSTGDGGTAITGYQIYRTPTLGSESLIDTIAPSGTPTVYTDTPPTWPATYTYRVVPVNAIGQGATSPSVPVAVT